MKKILVIAAMDVERELLLNLMTARQEITLANGSILTKGLLDGVPFNLLLCGIGKVNAAIGCVLALQEDPVDLVLNTGVAGGLLEHQQPGDMVIGDNVIYHDVDVTAFQYKRGQLPGGPEIYGTDMDAVNFLYGESRKNSEYGSSRGLIVSGDQFINSSEQVRHIKTHFPEACCAEMEAAAIGHAAWSLKVPFVIVRALSDKADSDAKHDYGKFVKTAAERSATLVRRLVNYYAKENTAG
jgi:adenosylhomocysteine nucleosidase